MYLLCTDVRPSQDHRILRMQTVRINLAKMYGVEKSFTSPYNPHGNAFCERFNRTLFGLLKTLKAEEKANWSSHLPTLVFAYNATPHVSTGYQPYQLMFGHGALAPLITG